MRKLYFLTIALACAYLLPQTLAAKDTCSASFTYSAAGLTANFFSVPGLPPATLHNWVFGDGSPSDGSANPVHTYSTPGTYWVKHYILNQGTNCNDSIIKEIRVPVQDCAIHPEFSFYRDSQNCRKIYFKNLSVPISPNVHFTWRFGDGTTSNETNPTHIYPNDGNFTVCLSMDSGHNCIKEVCKTVEVHCTTPPACNLEVKFEWKKDDNDPLKITFINQTLVPTTGATYSWSFGDGSGSSDRAPVHRYAAPGTYTVCLKVMISNTCIKQECKQIDIRIECPVDPRFTWKIEDENPRRVFFYNQSIVPSANVKFEWKFGDGTYSNEKDPVHLYEHAGEYEVCLTVRIGDDCKKTICQKLVLRECDVHAKFESRRDAAEWNKVWFANLSQPVSNIWRTSWTYGDGTGSQDFNSFHMYQQPGRYVVCLKVQSLHGCIDAYCDTVVIRRPDTCRSHSDFKFEVSANNPLEYRFKPLEVNLTWKYYWDFGDGKSSTAVAPVHKFDHAGVYKVCLTVMTNNNCRTNTCKEIRVGVKIDCDTVKLKFVYTRTTQRPNELSFRALSNVPITKQRWVIIKMGGPVLPPPIPVIIETNNPTYTFRDTGWYLVCLYAVTAGNCSKVYCERIHIERLGNTREIPGSPITVSPNPVNKTARIEFQMDVAGQVNFKVLDASGSVQLTFSAMGQAGNNSVNVPVDKLGGGLYFVEIRYANRLKLAKFQKS